MNRRFVNLLVSKSGDCRPAFNLHRINPASLFCPTRSLKPTDPAATKKNTLSRLPPAAISFELPCPWKKFGWMDFMARKNDIIAVDHEGHTLLYNGTIGALCAMNRMVEPCHSSISVVVGDDLYAMAINHGLLPKVDYFKALTYGRSFGHCQPEDWHWRPLQPPPLEYDHEKDQRYNPSAALVTHPCAIGAYTVVRDSQIWISTTGAGTYSFDTTSGVWRKIGEWALPFKGHAKYVPEHGLWFGFSDSDGQLCAADLEQMPPVQQKACEDLDLLVLEGWNPTGSHLLPLGSGKLCVVSFFQRIKRVRPRPSTCYRSFKIENTAVLAGVEVVAAGPEILHMVKHKSKCYRFGDDNVKLL